MSRLILASASPRRAGLLRMLGLPFEIVPSHISEDLGERLTPDQHVLEISRRKARAVAARFRHGLVLGADTVVALDDDMDSIIDSIMEKPVDRDDAIGMLTRLSGRTHRVFTGLTLVDAASNRSLSDVVVTHVAIRDLSQDEIRCYVQTGEPMDKAGAYAAQGMAAVFIESVSGCFLNVVGLPMALLWSMLEEVLGHTPWALVCEPPTSSGLFTRPERPASAGQAP